MTVTKPFKIHHSSSGSCSHDSQSSSNNNNNSMMRKKRDVVGVAKRSTAFKFNAPSKRNHNKTTPTFRKCNPDQGLQANNTQRRYLRRGSKCPSMLMLLAGKNMRELSKVDLSSSSPATAGHAAVHHKPMVRRMSLMTALKLSLEKTSIGEKTSAVGAASTTSAAVAMSGTTNGPAGTSTASTTASSSSGLQHYDCPMMNAEDGRKSTYELLSQI